MLVLSRKVGESIIIDNDITVTVVELSGNRVRLGIDAPQEVPIRRSELDPNVGAKKADYQEDNPPGMKWLDICFDATQA